MSQSGSNGSNGPNIASDSQTGANSQGQNNIPANNNGKSINEQKSSELSKPNNAPDLSNGFENRTMEYERYAQERAQERTVNQITHAGMTYQTQSQPQTNMPYTTADTVQVQTMQPVQFPPTARIPCAVNQLDERHPIPGQLAGQYSQDKLQPICDRVQYVSQTGTQIVPVQVQPQFTSQEYVGDQGQFSQIRSQFEVRSSQGYPAQSQYSDRAGYVTRDVAYRDQSVYSQPNSNPIFSGQTQYVTVQPQSSQSASPQPPYYSGVMIPSQTFAQFSSQSQFPYGQYPQTVMNPGTVPYSSHTGGNIVIGHPQQFGQQSPNPQGFSQDLGQYQNQPIIQPIAQNIAQGMQMVGGADRPNRGPKPMVPPRGNSKITHDSATGHRKSASVDVSSMQKPPQNLQPVHNKYDGSASSIQEIHRGDMACVPGAQSMAENSERRYLAPINQNPRTRQDGLYIDANGDKICPTSETAGTEGALYAARPEHRKSSSVDVTTSFQKRNDTITFTFPGDNQEILAPGRKLSNSELKRHEVGVFPSVGIAPSYDASARQENRKSVIGVERKPDWGGTISPGQRSISHENRRSDYFEGHRRSPLTLDQKRMDEVRKSPMPFVPIRDVSVDRASQKSPSFVNQAFEKTRQELAVWAEQRQRHEIERGGIQSQMFSTSPRSRNQSEDRKDARIVHQVEERRELRMSQSAFQPIPNISQNTIMEQRRHLRHVSADLTKHMELSRKDFDDQPTTGSVASLGPIITSIGSQRTSPSLCQQYPAISEAKIDAKCALTIATDFGDNSFKSAEQVDHIIHSHRKSHNPGVTPLLTHSKSQAEIIQAQGEGQNEGSNCQMQQQIQMHNQQSLDQISEKLSQFERQQSDLQTKLQCLQNQSQILDKVSQFQHQQSDLQAKMQSLQSQNQTTDKLGQIQGGHIQIHGNNNEIQVTKSQSSNLQTSEQITEKLSLLHRQQNEIQSHQNNLHNQLQQTLHQGFLPGSYKNNLQSQAQIVEKLSPRLQHDDSDPNPIQIPSMSQMPLPNLSQFDRNEVGRSSLQYRFGQCDAIDVGSSGSFVIGSSVSFTGTLKKVPPEKPPRTSLIVQSPEAESNRSQPAIGLKQTPKARGLLSTGDFEVGNIRAAAVHSSIDAVSGEARYIQASTDHRKLIITGDYQARNALLSEMDDHEIQSTVESILGPGVKVVDCEKKSCVREEEVLLINGVPIALEGPDGIAIREAMITGQVPPCDLLNQILVRAGILRAPVRLETSLSVKSSVVTKEEVTVARGGKIVDERSRETKENNFYTSSTSEIWEPVGIIHNHRNLKPFDSSDESRPNSNASSDQGYTTNTSSSHVLRERGGALTGCPICEDNDPDCKRHCMRGLGLTGSNASKVPGVQTTTSAPTIFGTVASDLNPKDGNSRRSLPQTPAGCTGAKGLSTGSTGSGNVGSAPGSGMANGASVEHQDLRDSAAINTEHALVYRDGNLVSGSLEALVQHMVPTEEYYPDRAYLFAFLLSARLFIKPHELLGEVCALCELQQNLTGEGGKERLHRFVPRLVQLLAEWTETFPYDFRDERVMGHVRAITQKVAAVDAAARQEVSALLQNLLLRLTALERYEEGLARLATEAAAEQLTQVDVTELCPSASVLAQQLTHVELERLSYIGPEEFVQAFAKESPHLETSFKDMKKTRNLESYVQWFNRLSYFVATEVCKHAKKKQRVRVVEYWIETARECFNIGNFNSLMAIIAGLNMSPISRLKKTWSKVQSAKFSILEHQMDPSSNFSSYRSTLKAAMWRSAGATDERQRIVVPFFSLLVKDLYFLNEGCSNKLPNGHINFEKFWQLAKQVTEFIAWKQVACPFEKNARVIAFLQASPVLTENSLALASFECEPPDNNPEKERYKSLKSELNAQ